MSLFGNVISGTSNFLGSAEASLSQAALGAGGSFLGGSGGNGAPLNAQSSTLPQDFVLPEERPQYQVTIIGSDADGMPRMVIGYMPESFSLQTSSNWSQPFADNTLGNTANIIGQLIGKRWTTQGMSSQFWSGTEPLEFSLDLTFIAETGPDDLIAPLQELYALQLPSITSNGFFKAPGPKLKLGQNLSKALGTASSALMHGNIAQAKNALAMTTSGLNTPPGKSDTQSGDSSNLSSLLSKYFQYENLTSLQLGTFMLFPSVVIKGISNEMKVRLTRDGIPLSATLNVSFATHQTPTAQDVENLFKIVPAGTTNTGTQIQNPALQNPTSAVTQTVGNFLGNLVSQAQNLI